MKYNFDEPVDRQGTSSVKYDLRKDVFGTEDLIPLWVADMDFKTPSFILEGIRSRLDHEILGYTFRRKAYFTSLVDWVSSRYSWDIKSEWITFSPGVVPALNMSTLAFTDPGDKVIVQPPVYFPFFPAVEDHGRTLVFNPLKESDGRWVFDFENLRKLASEGSRMLMLSNPHNPVGRAWSREELLQLATICLENNIIILSDEIHSDLVMPGYKHTPVASLSSDISEITVTFMAPSKTFNLAGMSTSSLIISNPDLLEKFNKVLQKLHVGMGNILGIEASIAAYSYGSEWLSQLLDYLKINIEFVTNFISENIPLIKPVTPEATYMIWLDCKGLGLSGQELPRFFIEKAGLGLNEGSQFGEGGEGYMRINIACRKKLLEEAMEKLKKAVNELKK